MQAAEINKQILIAVTKPPLHRTVENYIYLKIIHDYIVVTQMTEQNETYSYI